MVGYPISEIEENIDTTKVLLSTLTARDFEAWINRWYGDDRNWVYIMQGNNADYLFPSKQQIAAAIREARQLVVEPEKREEKKLSGQSLVDFEQKGGEIVKEKLLKPIGTEEWVLGNGAKVYYKYTNYNKGMFNILAGSRGGRSLLPAEDLPSADVMVAMFLKNGLYKYDNRALNSIMQGHSIDMNISLDETSESFNCTGMASDADMAFQFLYLSFEQPRFERSAFDKYIYVNKTTVRHSRRTTDDMINDRMRQIRMLESPRLWQRDTDYYNAMDYDKMVSIFKDRYQDASDFVFYLVGDLDREEARVLVEKYIGSLSSMHRKEHPVKHAYYKQGPVKEDIEADIPEQKYIVDITFKNTLKTKPMDKISMYVLQVYFDHLFQQTIREAEGGSYGVHITGDVSDFPGYEQSFNVQFESSLEKGPRMREIVHDRIRQFLTEGLSDDELEGIVMMLKKQHEASLKEIGSIPFWTENIQFYLRTGKRLDSPEFFEDIVERIKGKDVSVFARKFFKDADCIDIVVKSRD